MSLPQLLLILVGLAVAAGGVLMLLRGATMETTGTPRPYAPLGVIAAGLVIAYHSYSDYAAIDPLEMAGLFLFGLAFASALAIKLFVADKVDIDSSHARDDAEGQRTSGSGDKTPGGGSN